MKEVGEPLGEVAVIYRNHSQVDKLVEVLEKKGVPLNIKRKVDILQLRLIKNILTILRFLQNEYTRPYQSDDLLFEIMHYHFFGINSYDIAKISLHCSYKTEGEAMHFKDVISNSKLLDQIGIENKEPILALNSLIIFCDD